MAARIVAVASVSWPSWQPLLFLIPAILPTGSGWGCPSRCDCASQDKVVSCNGRRLTTVPGDLPPDSEFLDLSHNHLRTLQQGMFSRLQALKELDLSHSLVSNIDPGAFNSLQRLMTLRLKGNELKIIPAGIFTGLPNLTVLDISENQIVIFLDFSFQDLSSLRRLEAGDNHLVFISDRAFGGLQRLQQLTLEKCNLTSVPARALAQLRQLVELRFKVLNISSIPNYSFWTLQQLKVLGVHRSPLLSSLEPHSLSGLNLTALSLTRCGFRLVPYEAVRHLAYLRLLDLSHNPISVIHGRRLSGLLRLQEFHLAGGQLLTVQTSAFQGLNHVRLLNVSGNRLQTLEEGAFHSVGNLEVLRLDGNPLACDCRLLWIVRRRRRLDFQARQPACATPPAVRGKVFHEFSEVLPGHFTCRKPRIPDKTLQRVSVEEGGQAALTCQSDGDPPPTVSWLSPQKVQFYAGRKGRIRVLLNGTLEIRHALLKDAGPYHCVASNAAGRDTLVAHLHVSASTLPWGGPVLGTNLSLLNASEASRPPTLDVGILVGILALGVVPFFCSVSVCFVCIFLWSKGRGTAKHLVVESAPRRPRGYKAVSSKRGAAAAKPR